MHVIKRDGRKELVHFDKITSRISKLCYGLDTEWVDSVVVAQKVCMGVYKGVTTSELDELAAETAAHLTSEHPDYGILAARICISNLHKNTQKVFSEVIKALYTYVHPITGESASLIDEKVYDFIQKNVDVLNSAIVYDRDFCYDYFGFKTLERSYLLKLGKRVVERPQHMIMRVSCGIHCGDIERCIETYNLMSQKWFTHASPTLFNSGTPQQQLSSCFLLAMQDDSLEGIYETLMQCAQISKGAGGIGLSVHNIRATGSYIRGTGGNSNGLVPMLRVFNNTARYVDQGGGKRKGAFAVYLEPWHADIFSFLDLKKNHGDELARARDLFYGLWVPDLFMERVEQDEMWSLMCPNESPGLFDVWGKKFVQLYEKYETEGKFRKQIKARSLWQAILESQTETGTPYMLYKDSCNRKSNQKNLGTIRSSNLCTEIIEYTSADEVAVCNLASIALPMFVKKITKKGAKPKFIYDHKKLFEVTQVVTRNLNKVIDINYYPIKEARNSNFRHRPIGIGVQGLADAFIKMGYPFDSEEAIKLNKEIFETLYFSALSASKDLAKEIGKPYESYEGSPMSAGILQFDMWKDKDGNKIKHTSNRLGWDWTGLREEIKKYGVRNSLLIAPMPTASTSQILGNNECFEPYTSNLYVRRTLAGEFVCVSRYLLTALIDRGLWTMDMKNKLVANNGSVQNIAEIPKDMKDLYKTVWEISQKKIIDMAADRGAFIDQSQSFNVHMVNSNYGKLTSMHFYAWKKGLKTGMYYLRSQAAVDAIKFTVDQKALRESNKKHTASSSERHASTQGSPIRISPNSEKPREKGSPLRNGGPLRTLIFEANGNQNSETHSQRAQPKNVNEWRVMRKNQEEALQCALDNKDECVACGS